MKHPKTLNEKLVKLKLTQYKNNPLVKQCADKYEVRQYLVKKELGDILVPLIAVYDNVDDIDWVGLPERFVMKINVGSGLNIICNDKNQLRKEETLLKLRKWSRNKQYLTFAELQYKDVPLKIVVETYLQPTHGTVPADYKVYCFNGNPLVTLYMDDRGEHTKAAFFDMEWNFISEPIHSHYEHFEKLPEKPACMKQMIDVSRTLSADFPFVRMDYYVVDGKLYFGEMTFTPASGLFTSECLINGRPMGDYLNI